MRHNREHERRINKRKYERDHERNRKYGSKNNEHRQQPNIVNGMFVAVMIYAVCKLLRK